MESFQELGLPDFLAGNLKKMNFVKPTPVQAQAIPAGLAGKDVIASAQTGTGKTGAFSVPLLTYLENNKDKTALVLTPTRELAMQVLEVLRTMMEGHYMGGSVLLIGGANMGAQLSVLQKKPRVVIGTPGRVIDHLNRGSLNLSTTGFLVLDEADRMLDMGFAPQLDQIRQRLTGPRQTLLFSATFPADIQRMASQYLKEPVRITVGSTTQPVQKIAQMVIHTTEAKKFEELMGELQERQGSVLIFARTQHRVDRVMEKLKDQGVKVTRIHGGRTQSQRKQAIEQFREGRYLVLVATDIAARGLDIHHIAHVINYDLPRNPEDYVHRVGRTARAGAEGSSLCLLTPEDRQLWGSIQKLIGGSQAVEVKASRFGSQPRGPHGTLAEASSRGQSLGSAGSKREPAEGRALGVPVRGERPFEPQSGPVQTPSSPGQPQRHRPVHHPSHQVHPSRHEPKHRHPGGRHQRRSEEHHRRLEARHTPSEKSQGTSPPPRGPHAEGRALGAPGQGARYIEPQNGPDMSQENEPNFNNERAQGFYNKDNQHHKFRRQQDFRQDRHKRDFRRDDNRHSFKDKPRHGAGAGLSQHTQGKPFGMRASGQEGHRPYRGHDRFGSEQDRRPGGFDRPSREGHFQKDYRREDRHGRPLPRGPHAEGHDLGSRGRGARFIEPQPGPRPEHRSGGEHRKFGHNQGGGFSRPQRPGGGHQRNFKPKRNWGKH